MKASIILADIPWKYNARSNPKTRFGLGMHGYKGMDKPEILALPVADIAADNCALFFWVVPTLIRSDYVPLEIMFECFRAWGFRHVTKAFCWVKVAADGIPRRLPGHYTASNTEDCYLAIKGQMPVDEKMVGQVITAEITGHSRKPAEAQTRIASMYRNVDRVELFARDYKAGWYPMGDAISGQDINAAMGAYAAL